MEYYWNLDLIEMLLACHINSQIRLDRANVDVSR